MGFGSGPKMPAPPAPAPPPPILGAQDIKRRKPKLASGVAQAFSLRIPRPDGSGTNYNDGGK